MSIKMELECLCKKELEKTKVKHVFCIPKQLDGLKTLLDSFSVYLMKEKGL
jgi:hypothetical protein